MSAFTVIGVHDKEEWTGNYGAMVSYVLDLEDESGFKSMDVKLNRKPESREPEVGETFIGNLESGKFGDKLKIDFEATKELKKGGGGSQFRSSETSTGKPKGDVDWDRRNAEIRRQHSQQVAIEAVTLLGPAASGEQGPLRAAIKDWADWFDIDAIGAGVRHSAPDSNHPEPSVDLSGARTEEPSTSMPDDTHQWLESLLGVAGATHGARELALYAVNKLRPDQLKTLEGELNDHEQDRKAHGLKRLEASYEKAEGHPVPADNFDDLPF